MLAHQALDGLSHRGASLSSAHDVRVAKRIQTVPLVPNGQIAVRNLEVMQYRAYWVSSLQGSTEYAQSVL